MPNIWRALKSVVGHGGSIPSYTVTAAAIAIPEDALNMDITSSGNVIVPTAAFVTATINNGRMVYLTNVGTGDITFVHTAYASATEGNFTHSGGNLTLTDGETLFMRQRSNGAWTNMGLANDLV